MAQRAGVALSRIAKGATITITRVDGAPYEPYYFKPVEHNVESGDPAEITAEVATKVGFDTTLTDNGFLIAYPISITDEKRGEFKDPSHDHFMAFVNGYDFSAIVSKKGSKDLEALFIDLTPGQVASQLWPGGVWTGHWTFKWPGGSTTILNDAGDLTPQDVVDKLIKPTIGKSSLVDLVGILRPEGESPEILSVLEAQFPNTVFKWVTLTELSHGAAIIMHRENGSFTRSTCM